MSELLTNAVRARSSFARLNLALHRDVLRISVVDDAPGLPRQRSGRLDDHATTGWGVHIVNRIAIAYGVDELIRGKAVWAELPIPLELTLDMASCHHPTRFDPRQVPAVDPSEVSDLSDQAGARKLDVVASNDRTDEGQ